MDTYPKTSGRNIVRAPSRGMGKACASAAVAVIAAVSLTWTPPAAAQSPYDAADAGRYTRCMSAVETNPSVAYERALAWRFEGGGAPARHCVAAALVGLGQYAEGAARLQEAAALPETGGEAIRAEMLAQSGSAWLQAGRPGQAETVLTQALSLRPGDVDLLIDRGLARALQEQYRSAAEDLSVALSARPDDMDALRLRANAWVEMGRYEEAARDVIRGLQLVPGDVELLLVRGRVVQALGSRTPAALR